MLVIGALALTLSIVIMIFLAEVTSAVLPALVLYYLVPAEERADLTALIEATRKRAGARKLIPALRNGLILRLRSHFRPDLAARIAVDRELLCTQRTDSGRRAPSRI